MFSIGELHSRLKAFKADIRETQQPLFFVKLDVRAAFDTIPQTAAVELMRTVPSLRRYIISKHAEVKPGECLSLDQRDITTKPIRRWQSTATSDLDDSTFLARVEKTLGAKKKSTVFVDSAVRSSHDAQALYNLLSEHVSNNIVKVGKKFYRQKRGIPQGSVLSSFLCNYFYADLESRVLDFLIAPDCLLLRLIDDFLLITLDRSKAERFLEVMHGGVPEYGVEVSPEKTLVNFDVCSSQGPVRKVETKHLFPYCGTLIDCQSLEIRKDRGRDSATSKLSLSFRSQNQGKIDTFALVADTANSLTIEYGRAQGHNFQRKVLGKSLAAQFDRLGTPVSQTDHVGLWQLSRLLQASITPHVL
jgi:telomerase reverse transcriptase